MTLRKLQFYNDPQPKSMRILVFCFLTFLITIKTQAQTIIEKPDGVTVTTYSNGAVVTSFASCNMWRDAWTQDGDLDNYKPNPQEIAIFESIKNLTTSKYSGLKSDIKMVRQDITDDAQRYFVLFDILNPDGTVRIHREMDLATYKSHYD